MSDASINPSLILATLDLSLVQMLTQAMRTADIAAAATVSTHAPAAVNGISRSAAASSGGSDEHRWASKPAAIFEPRHGHRYESRCCEDRPCNSAKPVQAVDPVPSVQPPWKTLAWPTKHLPVLPPGHRVIKIQQNNSDVSNVGRTLDLFV